MSTMVDDEYKTAYGFVQQVREDLDELEVGESQVALDVDMNREENTITLDYNVESLEWYEKELGKDGVSYINSYTFTSEDDLVPTKEVIESLLEGNFLDTALRLDGNVIRESPSPDYDAF